jgi:hypothetical protein
MGHRRELASDRMPGQKESAAVHDADLAIETTRRTMNSQRTVTSVLTGCLSPGAHLTSSP